MKIVVVSSIFIPDLGYMEEGIAKVLTTMSHDVTVLASFHYPFNTLKKIRTSLNQDQTIILRNSNLSYRIVRLKTFLKIRTNIICFGLRGKIQLLNPDLVILIGVSDFFPMGFINKRLSEQYKTYAFIGQNYDMSHWHKTNSVIKRFRSYVINNLIKGFLYRRSIRYLSKIIFYTPDTEEIISKFLSHGLRTILNNKKVIIPLGFSSDDFYFSNEARNLVRKRLNIPSYKVVLITVTRIEKSKKIVEIINDLFIINKLDITYLLIGFIENQYKIEIERLIRINQLQDKILCFPFLSNESLVDYLSASDFGVWLQSGASIQQAMGTGLPIFLPKKNTTSILLQEGLNGYYIDKKLHDTLLVPISSYSFSVEKRKQIEQYNKSIYSYQSILQKVID